ncbi:hypothetical protein QL285_029258 [Trifolium repens]|nr:hypothetical protein QL285_029258 [Trifolium repens]
MDRLKTMSQVWTHALSHPLRAKTHRRTLFPYKDFIFSVRRREELNEKGARREGRNTASMSSGGRRSGGGFHAARLNDEEVLFIAKSPKIFAVIEFDMGFADSYESQNCRRLLFMI